MPKTTRLNVTGLQEHKAEVAAFCLAVCEASARRRSFHAIVERDSEDSEIRVDGVVGDRTWRIGYIAPSQSGLPDGLFRTKAVVHTIAIGPRGPREITLETGI